MNLLMRLRGRRTTLLHSTTSISTLLYLSLSTTIHTIASAAANTNRGALTCHSIIHTSRHHIAAFTSIPITTAKQPLIQTSQQSLIPFVSFSHRINHPIIAITMPTTRSGRLYSSNFKSNQKDIDPLPPSSSSSIDKVHYVSPSPPNKERSQSSSIPLKEQSAVVNSNTVVALSVGDVSGGDGDCDSRISKSGTFKVEQKKRYDFSIFAHSGDGDNVNDTNNTSTSNNNNYRNNTANMVSSGKMLSIDNIFFGTFRLNITESKSTAVRWIFFYRLFTVKSRGPHCWIIFRNFRNFSYGSILFRHFPNIFLLTRIDFSMLSMDNILLYEIYVEFLY